MPIDQPPSTEGNTARLFGSLGVMTLGVAGTLVTVLGFFGSAWWAFDLLSGYRMQLAVVLLAVAAGFRIGFGMATGALFLAAAITNIVIVAPFSLDRGSRPCPPRESLRSQAFRSTKPANKRLSNGSSANPTKTSTSRSCSIPTTHGRDWRHAAGVAT